jgi:hypothetical protein
LPGLPTPNRFLVSELKEQAPISGGGPCSLLPNIGVVPIELVLSEDALE